MTLQKLKILIVQYFEIWWIPILSYIVPFLIYLLGTILRSDFIINVSVFVFYINIFGNIISSIVQIVIGKWFFIIPQIGISYALFLFVAILFTFSPPDYYGAHKTIPNDIQISKPLDRMPNHNVLVKHKLILSCSSQPGIYNFYTNVNPSELGTFYIKAYEITSNDKLSEERIKSSSKVKVESLKPKIHSGEFTIYEGSWGDKYAARIELWFETSNKKKDYKIAQRNYIVEGWMR